MNKIIVLLIMVTLLVGTQVCFADSGFDTLENVNKQLSVPFSSCTLSVKTVRLTDGVDEILLNKKYQDLEKIVERGRVKKDEFGIVVLIYPDGKEKTRATYKSGKYRGREIIFFFDRKKSEKSVQIGKGNEWYRVSGVSLGKDFFGRTALRLINLGILEDTQNYDYEEIDRFVVIGHSKDTNKTFYDSRFIVVQDQESGSFVEKFIRCSLNGRAVTVISVKEFVNVAGYWKPSKVVVIDLVRKKISLLEFTNWKVSQDISEQFFRK
ncbi:hypothetical protein KAR91_27720 [Candidatus Pacearchaeota archaeon]|nr:hypothetical protein [Candidatus Pacearchaeota archaeon]